MFLVFSSFFISVSKSCSRSTKTSSFKLQRFSRPFARVKSALIHSCVRRSKNSMVSMSFPERFRLLFYYTHRRQNVHYSSVNVCFIRMIMLNTSWFSRDIRVFIVQNFRGEPCFITYGVHNVWYALSRKKKREIEGWRAKFFRSLSISCGYHQSQRKIAAFGTFCKLCDNSVRWREVHLVTIYNAEIVVCGLWNRKWWIRLFQLK